MMQTNLNNQPNVNNSSVVLAAQPSEMGVREMSSLEIAELTGKQHSNVMRDIRALLDQGVNQINFELVDYTDKKGEKRSMYNLTKKGSLILASGYNAVLREKIIDRWEAIETGQATPIYQAVQQPKQQQLTMKDKLTWIKEVQKMLKLNDASTLGLLQQVADPLGLPVPQYVDSKGILISATAALFDYQTGIKVNEFNKRMIEKGFLEELSRKSSKGIVKMFKHITPSGLKYGENQVNPKSPQQTQPLYYKHKFPELLKELGLK